MRHRVLLYQYKPIVKATPLKMPAYLLPILAVPNVIVRSVFLCSILRISPDTPLCSYLLRRLLH